MAEQVESKATNNQVEVIGYVLENKIKVEDERIMGSVVVKYGEKADEQVEVKIYVGSKTKNGDHNKKYDDVKKLAETLVSVSQATEGTNPSVVRINGSNPFTPSLELNEYPAGDKILGGPQVSMGFGNLRLADKLTSEDFKGEFEMDIFLATNPKLNDDVLEVKGYYVTYKGEIKPLDFVVRDEVVKSGIEACSKGDTIEVFGDIKIAKIVTSTKKKSGFGGKGKTSEDVKYTSELEIWGGNMISETDKRAIDPSFVKTALVEREAMLEEMLKNADKPTSRKGTGGGFAGGVKNNDPKLKF